MPDMLDVVTHSGVVVEGWFENFLRKSHSRISLERRELEILAVESIGWPYSLASAICLWISSSRTRRSRDPPISGSLSDYVDGWLSWRATIRAWLVVALPECLLLMMAFSRSGAASS